jgi:molybdopterin-guanine dinucleotide biosynthesis protein A
MRTIGAGFYFVQAVSNDCARGDNVPEVSVAILAGGQSRRMGQDKAFLPVGGSLVIERVIQRVALLSSDLTIVTNTPDEYRRHLSTFPAIASRTSYRIVSDVYPGKGSLGGIYTAIHVASYSHCLVVACDMPFLNTGLLRHLMALRHGFDVVIPRTEEFPETMHAVYGKGCLEPIRRLLLADKLKIVGFFDDVRVRYVERDEVARFDPSLYSFLNMNTLADWERVQQLASGE